MFYINMKIEVELWPSLRWGCKTNDTFDYGTLLTFFFIYYFIQHCKYE